LEWRPRRATAPGSFRAFQRFRRWGFAFVYLVSPIVNAFWIQGAVAVATIFCIADNHGGLLRKH
jgi:hypothetical protein